MFNQSKQRALCIFMTALVGVYSAVGQEPAKPPQLPQLPPDLEPVFGLAMAAPPEFTANALLLIQSRLPTKELRRDLIDLAFRLASKGQNPVRLSSFAGTETDTRSGYVSSALKSGLDVLSLQSQAVQEMIGVDPVRARELFGEIGVPAPFSGTCEDSLLPDVSSYFATLAALVKGGFSAEERGRGEQIAFATTALMRVSVISELAPAARLLYSVDLPKALFEVAEGVYLAKLENAPLDSRSFLHYSKGIEAEVGHLIAKAGQFGGESTPILNSYRTFLVKQFRGPRCADSGKPAGKIVQTSDQIGLFMPAIRGDQPAITGEEMEPETAEGQMRVKRFWQSTEGQRVYQECMKLRQAPDGTNLPEAARRTKEWSRQLTDVLSLLAAWPASAEGDDAVYYHEKAIAYEALLELTPPGEMSDRVLESFIGFVKNSSMQQQNTVEWFWHARSAVERARPGHADQAAKIVAAYKGSGNIVLMLEAMLDQIGASRP